jgi:hypothetical protein
VTVDVPDSTVRVPSRRHAFLIARTELTRRYRAIRGDPRRSVAVVIALLFAAIPSTLAIGGAYLFGTEVRTGGVSEVLPIARSVTGGLLAIVLVMTLLRVASNNATIDHADGILTAVPHRDVTAGLMLAESASVALPVGALAAISATSFAVGARSPATAVAAVAAVLMAVVLGLLSGFALGVGVRLAVARVRVLARYKTHIAAVLFLAYMAALLLGPSESLFSPAMAILRSSPAGWYGDLALVAIDADANLLRGLAAIAATALLAPALVALSASLTGSLWFGDPVRPGSDDGADPAPHAATSGGAPRSERRAARTAMTRVSGGPYVDRSVERIARKNWLRARRGPMKLAYVLYPVFFLYAPIRAAIEAGAVTPSVLTSVALYLAWSTGAAFTLNPLGDEGAALPTTRTAPVSGREFVAGYCLAGIAVGAPVVAVATLLAGILGGASPATVVATAALGALLAVCSTGIAAGAGTAFPKFEESKITRSRSVVVPSLLSFAAYSIVLFVAGAPGSLTQVELVREALAGWLRIGEASVRFGGLGLTAALAVLAALVGVAYASRGFERYEF